MKDLKLVGRVVVKLFKFVNKSGNVSKKIKKFWNQNIAGNSSFLRIGARRIEAGSGNAEQVNIVGPTKRSLISHPMVDDNCSITIEKLDGKGDTDIDIYAYDKDLKRKHIASTDFNKNKARKNSKEKYSDKFSGVKGKIIVIVIKGNSIARNFKGKVCITKAKRA